MNDAERHRIFERILAESGWRLQMIVRNNADAGSAQDLRQEILMALWRSLGTFKGKSSLATWVYRVAMNTTITFKKNNSRPETLMAAVPEVRAGVSGKGTNRDPRRILDEFIQSLGEVDRQVFVMYLEDQSYRDMSEQTLIAEASLRKQVHRLKQEFTARYLGA